jgi:uncharacterized protein YqeY
MLTLIQILKEDKINHFKAGNRIASTILGLVESEAKRYDKEPADDIVLRTINKMIESNEISLRHAFDSKLSVENDTLRAYLPKQKTEIQTRIQVSDLIESGIDAVGTLNKWFKDNWNNQYNSKLLNQIIKEKLNELSNTQTAKAA